jgi:acetyltransferase-like isoleucine patch superfamily enzyme
MPSRAPFADRRDPHAAVKVMPVRIGANVWIGARVGALPGTSIGDNSASGLARCAQGSIPRTPLIGSPRATVIGQLNERPH